ncbi:MAG: hypothetical protein EOO67_01595 [Microbacterium sp.]|nr:MAG: hypothetical protein EOO67_01595 [Microbacterium sp.]
MTPRLHRSGLRALIPASVVALALVLTACVPEGEPTSSPSGSPSGGPSSSAAPTPLAIPGCEELLTRADIDRLVSPDAESFDLASDVDLTQFTPTDDTAAAVTAATSARGCSWGIPQTDSGSTVVVAELAPGQAAPLRAGLAADGMFTEQESVGAADVFAGDETDGFGYGFTVVVLDAVLLTVQGPAWPHGRDLALQVLASLRAANPGLPDVPVDPVPSETAAPSPSPSPSPSATPDSPDAPDAAVIPSCGELIPLPVVRALFADAADTIAVSGSPADHMPGPLAARTVRTASQAEMCAWGVPASDGGFSVVTAEITAKARDELIDALRSASGYRERALGGEIAFTREVDNELGTTTVAYVFVDTVWITVNGTLDTRTARELAAEALDAVRLANS